MRMIGTKRNMLLILFALLTVSVSTNAQQLTEQQALQNANEFLSKRGRSTKISVKKSMRKAKSQNSQEAAFYVFNVGDNEGFVIASGDERTEKILGYSDNGTFDEENMPDNMKAWLQGYADQISNLPEDYVATASGEMNHPAIEPLIKTKWGQGAPYNAKCPEMGGNRCVTGCVPTALAQILNYHQYPNTLPALDVDNAYWGYEALPEYNIDWNTLKNEYTSSESDDNLAWLMRYCGQAVHVNYGPAESSVIMGVFDSTGTEIEDPLRDNFGYNKYMKAAYRGKYSVKGWNDLLISELKAKRPIYLSGNGTTMSGHAFICDGYDGNGLYHINWGWNGNYNGYFCIEILNPFTPSAIDEKNSDTYSNMLNAAIGVTPQETMIYPDFIVNCYWNSSSSGYWISIGYIGYNMDLFPEGKVAIGIFNADGNLIERRLEHSIRNGAFGTSSPFGGSGLKDGHYYMKALFKPSANEDWHDVSFDWNVIELIKEGMALTVIDSSHIANEVLDLSITTRVIGEGKINKNHSIEVVVTNNGGEIAGTLCCDIMGKPNSPIKSYGGPYYETVLGAGETMTFLFDDIYKECDNFQEKGRYNYRLRWEELQPRYTNTGCLNKVLCYDSFLVTDENGQLPPVCSTPVVQASNGMIKGKSETKNSEFAYLLDLRSYDLRSFAGNSPSLCYGDEKIEIFMYAKAENHIVSDFICDSVVWKSATFMVDSIVPREVKNADLPKCSVPRLSIRDNLLIKECDTDGAHFWVNYYPESTEKTVPNNTAAPFFINIPMTATADATGYEDSDIVYGHLILSDLSFTKGEYAEISEDDIDSTTEDTDISQYDNILYFDKVTARAGTSLVLPLQMKNEMEVAALRFDLALPDGVTLDKNSRGKYDIRFNEEDARSDASYHSVTSSLQADGSVRVVCYSLSADIFEGHSGAIFDMPVTISGDIEPGDYKIVIKNIELTTPDGNRTEKISKVVSTMTIPDFMQGDANDDGEIGMADIMYVVNYLLGSPAVDFNANGADSNQDGEIGMADIMYIVQYLLTGEFPQNNAATAKIMQSIMEQLENE